MFCNFIAYFNCKIWLAELAVESFHSFLTFPTLLLRERERERERERDVYFTSSVYPSGNMNEVG